MENKKVSKLEWCPQCNGTPLNFANNNGGLNCPTCKGVGKIRIQVKGKPQ
jgi:DnaJ-class molecular chaperone